MIPASLGLLPSRRVSACGRACVRGVCGGVCGARAGAGCGQAQTRVTPSPCVATSVIDVHTTNVC